MRTVAVAHRSAARCSACAPSWLPCLGFIGSELRRRTTYPKLQMRPWMQRSVLLLRAAWIEGSVTCFSAGRSANGCRSKPMCKIRTVQRAEDSKATFGPAS